MEFSTLLVFGVIFYLWYRDKRLKDYSDLVSPDLSDFEEYDSYDDVSSGTQVRVDFSRNEMKVLQKFSTIGLEKKRLQIFRLNITSNEVRIFLVEEQVFKNHGYSDSAQFEVVKDSRYCLSEEKWNELNPGINFTKYEDASRITQSEINNGKVLNNPLSSMLIIRWNLYCSKYDNFDESVKFKHFKKHNEFVRKIALRDPIWASFLE